MNNKRTYQQYCGVAQTLNMVGERWTLLIIRDLILAPRRYSDLLDGLPGLTTNLLARRLKELCEHGVVEKVRLPPPASHLAYRLTEAGWGLESFVLEASEWGHQFLPAEESGYEPNLGWSLLRLKKRYRGNQSLVVELKSPLRIFHLSLKQSELVIREGPNPASELHISGSFKALCQLFFGPKKASELAADGDLLVEGEFGRWPRLLAAFGLF